MQLTCPWLFACFQHLFCCGFLVENPRIASLARIRNSMESALWYSGMGQVLQRARLWVSTSMAWTKWFVSTTSRQRYLVLRTGQEQRLLCIFLTACSTHLSLSIMLREPRLHFLCSWIDCWLQAHT